MHYVCVICKTEAPLEQGRPLTATRWPSWICRDADACAARVMPEPGAPGGQS